MGSFSLWHWIIVLAVVAFPLLLTVGVIVAVKASNARKRQAAAVPPPLPPTSGDSSRP